MEFRILNEHEVSAATQLIRNVFINQLALTYNEIGIKEFLSSFEDEKILSLIRKHHLIMIGAFDKEIIGVVGIRKLKDIQCLFVNEKYQNKHIGTKLLDLAKSLMFGEIFVNADIQAVDFYKKNGFVATQKIKTINGIKFLPMAYQSYNENKFMNYDQVHEFISKQKDRVYALDNFKRFMADLCNPQCLLKTIHVGGTNGKGSTTNYIRSVLQKEGYKVATFTSPVLTTRLEVMRINDKHILDHEIVMYANRYMSLWLEYELSMFEIEVFIAIMYFLNNDVDFAVFEVGLGGELDATNIVWPIITANTNIGMDHTEYLGDTYEKIAYTKGGIIKNEIPFFTGETKKECLEVFKDICKKHNSPFVRVQPILHINDDNYNVTFDYRNYHVVLNTSAKYQSQNSSLAIEILLYLRDCKIIHLDDKNLLEGLKKASWAGRFEVVNTNPLMIVDGAHNREGIEAFFQSAKKYTHIKIIFSALRDKDTHAMLQKLLELTDDITICEFDFYRAQSAIKLAESFPVKIECDFKKAIDDAFLHEGVVFITGSLYFISQVRPYIQNHKLNTSK